MSQYGGNALPGFESPTARFTEIEANGDPIFLELGGAVR